MHKDDSAGVCERRMRVIEQMMSKLVLITPKGTTLTLTSETLGANPKGLHAALDALADDTAQPEALCANEPESGIEGGIE